MKKIISVTTALALLGASLVYVGCTQAEDFAPQIEDLNADINTIEGEVEGLQTEIEALKNQAVALATVKVQLETAIEELKNKAGNAETVIGALQKQVAGIDATLTSVKNLLNDKVDKSYVEKTFATITALNKISEQVGSLKSSLEVVEKAVEGLEGDLTAAVKRIEAAETTLAQAVKDIEALKNDLYTNYYKKGEVDGLLALAKDSVRAELAEKAAELQANIDTLTNTVIANAEASVKADEELQALIEKEAKARINGDSLCFKEINRVFVVLNARIDAEVKALQNQIDAINLKIEEINKTLKKQESMIFALESRVEAISVCPTLNPEVFKLKVAESTSIMIKASFSVTPFDALEYVATHTSGLKLVYAQGLQRTKGAIDTVNVKYKYAEIVKVDKGAQGTLVVTAKGLDTLVATAAKSGYFFALTWKNKDAAGESHVVSDFAQAIESADVIDLASFFQFAEENANKFNFDFVQPSADTVDYTSTSAYPKYPFTKYTVAFDNRNPEPYVKYLLPDTVYTVSSFQSWTGIQIDTTISVAATAPVTTDNKAFQSSFGLSNVGASNVSSTYDATLTAKVNGLDIPGYIKKEVYFIQHSNTATIPTFNIPWNYKMFNVGDTTYRRSVQIDSADFSTAKTDWKQAVSQGATWDPMPFSAAVADEIFTIESGSSNEYLKVSSLKKLPDAGIQTDSVGVVKASSGSDSYEFTVKVKADAKQGEWKDSSSFTIPGSLSSKKEFVITNYLGRLYTTAAGTVKPEFISGLKGADAALAAVKEGVYAQYKAATKKYYFNGAPLDESKVPYFECPAVSTDLEVKLDASVMGYDTTGVFKVVLENFLGSTYEYTVNLTTTAPQFKLELTDWVVNDTVKANGNIKDGKYTVEDLNYSNYVKVKDIDSLTTHEATAATVKVVFDTLNVTKSTDKGIAIAVGKAGIAVDKATGALNAGALKWGTFNGHQFDVQAHLEINGQSIGDTLKYTVKTDDPVKMVAKEAITANLTKLTSGQTVKIFPNISVYGMENGRWSTANLIDENGAFITTKDYGCSMTYQITNASVSTSNFVISPNGVLTANISTEDTVTVDVKCTLNYDLSCGTPIEKTIKVTLNFDKAAPHSFGSSLVSMDSTSGAW